MTGRHEKPAPDPVHPPCMHCHSIETASHCNSPTCVWVRCGSCYRITDLRKLNDQGSQ